MTLQESIEILRKHNEWRRKEEGSEMLDPVKLDQAIDMAIEVLSGMSLPSNLDEAAEEQYPDFSNSIASKAAVNAVRDAFKAGAEWLVEQYEKIEGELVDWYSTSEGKDYCCGIKTYDSFEVPEGFYIKKK